MHYPQILALLILVLAGQQTFTLIRAHRTGRFLTRLGTATREHHPKRYRRYVISTYVVLAVCAGALVWVEWWPESFR